MPGRQVLPLLLMLAGCASPQWLTHSDPAGFSLDAPRGWAISSDARTGRIEIRGPEQQVVIWPVFLPRTLDAHSAAAVLARLSAASLPGVAWGQPRSAGPRAARAEGRSDTRSVVAVLTWVPSAKGAAGYIYVASAPQTAYRQAEPTFARILASFRLQGAPVKPRPQLAYVRWKDPRENAFSIDVPAGWTMTGGLYRFASVDTRGAWQAVSPEGIRVTGGDASLPTFTEPNSTLSFAGFREGTWYSPGYGVRMFVRRYLPGTQFAREYVSTKVAHDCADVRLTDSRDRADAVAALNAVYAQYGTGGVSFRLTAGEAAFRCNQQGRSMAGYYFAGTQRVQAAGMPGGIWNAEHLFGYLAPESRIETAQAVAAHMLASIQLNPRWVAMQQNIAANTSAIVSRTGAEISRMISDSYWNRQQVDDELSRRRSNATLGVEDVVDPATGRETKVESGSNYYWIDQRGTIVGTDTDTRPNLDFGELIRLP
jgi:hypothetical protein